MKKKTNIFFALLFAGTLAFSFGIATTANAMDCCNFGCGNGMGHKFWYNPHEWVCVRDFTDPCDYNDVCQ